MEPEQKLRRAFDAIYDRYPYFAGFVSTWKVRESKIVPTAATDGPNFWWNRQFIEGLTVADTTDLVLHEAGHVFLGHHLRQEGRENFAWNVAADLALNDLLSNLYSADGAVRRLGIFPGPLAKLPDHRYLEQGKAAEVYFDILGRARKEKRPQPTGTGAGQGQPGNGKAQEADGKGQNLGHGSAAPATEAPDEDAEAGGNSDEPEGYGGEDSPASNFGDVLPQKFDEDNPAAMEEAKAAWEVRVAQGINAAKAVGNLPGAILEIEERLHGGKAGVDWRLMLRRFMTQHVRKGQTYTRPSRRHGWRKDVIMPARKSAGASHGAVLLDTSGSMNLEDLNRALDEIEGILRVFDSSTVTLFQCDTRISDSRKFTKADFPMRMPMEWYGRGGTELAGPIAEIGKMPDLKWLVIITDMEWSVGRAKDPGIPTLWLPTRPEDRDGGWWGGRPSFGQIIPYKAFKG